MVHNKKNNLPLKLLAILSISSQVANPSNSMSSSLSRIQEMQQEAKREKIKEILEPYDDKVDIDSYTTVLQAEYDRIRLAKGLSPRPKREMRSPLSTKTDKYKPSVEQLYQSELLPIITKESQWNDDTEEGIFNPQGDSVHFEYSWSFLPNKDTLMLNRIAQFQEKLIKAIHKNFQNKYKRDYLKSSTFASQDEYAKPLFQRMKSIVEFLKNRLDYYNDSVVNPTSEQNNVKKRFTTTHAALEKLSNDYFNYEIPSLNPRNSDETKK